MPENGSYETLLERLMGDWVRQMNLCLFQEVVVRWVMVSVEFPLLEVRAIPKMVSEAFLRVYRFLE
jgi:hypothetical protein